MKAKNITPEEKTKLQNYTKQNPTPEESRLALKAQSPMDESRHDTAIAKVSTFKQLAKVSRSSRLMFGGNAKWIKKDDLFNPSYRNGLESAPFYITSAFSYKSKARGNAKALGVEMAFANGQMGLTDFGLNPGDLKRNGILAAFEDENGKKIQGAEPIGLFCIVRLSMPGKPNDYYDLVPYEPDSATAQADVEIPFVEIRDDEIPF